MATKRPGNNEGNAGGQPTGSVGGSLMEAPSAGQGSVSSRPASTSSGTTGGAGAGTAVAKSLYDQAKETAGQAYEVAAEKATTKLEEQKTNLSGGLASIAGSVRQVSDNLRGPDVQDGISKFAAEYSEVAATKIEGVANYFERKNVRDMYADLEKFARRNPAVFVGGAFALGLLAARFLKSGSRSFTTSESWQDAPTFDAGGQAGISTV